MLRWLWCSALIVGLDQLTKVLAERYLEYLQPVAVLPSFNLTLMYNTGAAFSFLADAGGWQKFFFTGLAFAVSGWLGWQIVQRKFSTLMNWAAAFIIGGALGNVIDRLIHGHVIDFIQVHWQQSWYYPAFNIADSFICVGAALMVLDSFRQPRS